MSRNLRDGLIAATSGAFGAIIISLILVAAWAPR